MLFFSKRSLRFSVILIQGHKKSTFSRYSFGRVSGKKEYIVYVFDNYDNYGRPIEPVYDPDNSYVYLGLPLGPWKASLGVRRSV